MEIIHLDKLMNQQSIPLYMTPNPPQQYMHISPFAAELLDQIRLIGKKVNTENDNTICVEFYPVGTVCTPPPPHPPLQISHTVLSFVSPSQSCACLYLYLNV